MSALDPYIGALKAIVLVAIVLGLLWAGHHFGARGVQADWNKDIADRAKAEKAAVLARVTENQGIFRQQEITNQNITKAHNEEIDKLRNDLAAAKRVRVGPSLCPRSTSQADTTSPGSSDATDPGAGLVSESTQRSIDALIMQVEEALATGRACQAFVTNNGMAP